MRYELLEKDRQRYIGLVLLNEIINFQSYFPVDITGEGLYLKPHLEELYTKGFLVIDNGSYVPTELGRSEVVSLYAKYYEYLKMFDLYCAVDLEEGTFAFSQMFDNFTDEQWLDFISNDRFSDIRVAVAEFKGINPIEIVFMSFLNENRFDCTAHRWEHALTGNDVWKEILDIVNTAISKEYLHDEQGVLEDIVTKGSALAIDLLKQAEEISTEEDDSSWPEEEVTEEVTTEYVEIVEMPVYEYEYWDPYYDPYYISPIWLVPIVLW